MFHLLTYSFFYKSVYNSGIFVTLTCTRFLSSVFFLLHPSNIGDCIFFSVFLPPCFLSSHFLSSPIFLSSKHTLKVDLKGTGRYLRSRIMKINKLTWSKSEKTSSKLITSISALGSTFPFTCTMSLSSKHLTT